MIDGLICFLNPWLSLFDSRAVSLSQEMVPEIDLG